MYPQQEDVDVAMEVEPAVSTSLDVAGTALDDVEAQAEQEYKESIPAATEQMVDAHGEASAVEPAEQQTDAAVLYSCPRGSTWRLPPVLPTRIWAVAVRAPRLQRQRPCPQRIVCGACTARNINLEHLEHSRAFNTHLAKARQRVSHLSNTPPGLVCFPLAQTPRACPRDPHRLQLYSGQRI